MTNIIYWRRLLPGLLRVLGITLLMCAFGEPATVETSFEKWMTQHLLSLALGAGSFVLGNILEAHFNDTYDNKKLHNKLYGK